MPDKVQTSTAQRHAADHLMRAMVASTHASRPPPQRAWVPLHGLVKSKPTAAALQQSMQRSPALLQLLRQQPGRLATSRIANNMMRQPVPFITSGAKTLARRAGILGLLTEPVASAAGAASGGAPAAATYDAFLRGADNTFFNLPSRLGGHMGRLSAGQR